MQRLSRRRGAGGFTLVEVLISLFVMSLVALAVTAMSFSAFISIGDGAQERQQDATTAQWTSIRFARDIQGASSLVVECAPGTGAHLFTVQASDSSDRVEYRYRENEPGLYELTRTECDSGGAPSRVVGDLEVEPTVVCGDDAGTVVPCDPGTKPRLVTLNVTRTKNTDGTDRFGFELDGARRLTGPDIEVAPLEVPTFVGLGGTTPLSVGGNGKLRVIGDAMINRPPSGTAVKLAGSNACSSAPDSCKLWVAGEFRLQAGATCSGCGGYSATQPGGYQTALPDPLRFLEAPATAGLPVRTNCAAAPGGERVCEPGNYTTTFPPVNGNSKVTLLPGIYVLSAGMSVQNGTVEGSDVLLYNKVGQVKVNGGSIKLTPSTSGRYAGILFFQARNNNAGFSISGNTAFVSLAGMIYAPASSSVELGSGGGEFRVGRVIGQNLSVSGNGTVIVDGN